MGYISRTVEALVKDLMPFADFCIFIFFLILSENVLLCLRSVLQSYPFRDTCKN